MNTISYRDLKDYYLNNEDAVENAKKYFGKHQPNIYSTGFYSAPSWNWGYRIGITCVHQDDQTLYFDVVTQFGEVKAARKINLEAYN